MPNCALCGITAPPPFRAPPPESAPDLDGRPGEPTRSTLRRWLQSCRNCGACAPDLAALPASAAPVIQSEAYHALPSPFLRWAALVAGMPDEAEALLQAAWEAEDAGRDGRALRRRAVALWSAPEDAQAALRLADIQRRAGMMGAASATLDTIRDADPETARVAAFERDRIAAGDMGRHLLSSALRPPATKPHVAHTQARSSSFWARMLGR